MPVQACGVGRPSHWSATSLLPSDPFCLTELFPALELELQLELDPVMLLELELQLELDPAILLELDLVVELDPRLEPELELELELDDELELLIMSSLNFRGVDFTFSLSTNCDLSNGIRNFLPFVFPNMDHPRVGSSFS